MKQPDVTCIRAGGGRNYRFRVLLTLNLPLLCSDLSQTKSAFICALGWKVDQMPPYHVLHIVLANLILFIVAMHKKEQLCLCSPIKQEVLHFQICENFLRWVVKKGEDPHLHLHTVWQPKHQMAPKLALSPTCINQYKYSRKNMKVNHQRGFTFYIQYIFRIIYIKLS